MSLDTRPSFTDNFPLKTNNFSNMHDMQYFHAILCHAKAVP